MANNFRWFDQPAQYSPRGMEDYVSGTNSDMGYQPSQQGFLSLLGAGISGGIAPFVGDNQWLERRTKQQMEQAQSEAEFRALLLKQRQQGNVNKYISPEQQIATLSRTRELAAAQGLDPNSIGFGVTATGSPTLSIQPQNKINPSLQNYRNKLTENVINTYNDVQNTNETINTALSSVNKLESGLKGKVTYGVIKNLDANNPLLQDWQNLKIALTDAQLQSSGPLKGAISDSENKWLAAAAANDDLISIPRAKAVFDKLKRAAATREKTAVQSFKRIYKEDPYQWDELKSSSVNTQGTVSNKYQKALQAGYTKEEIDAYLKGKK